MGTELEATNKNTKGGTKLFSLIIIIISITLFVKKNVKVVVIVLSFLYIFIYNCPCIHLLLTSLIYLLTETSKTKNRAITPGIEYDLKILLLIRIFIYKNKHKICA